MTEIADPDATTAEVRAVPDAPYPAHWEADVVASDGATAHLRPISADDADDVVAFHGRLSDRTRYFRYFSPYPRIPERDLKNFVEVDHHDRVALVLWLGREIIAIGRYVRLAQTTAAEVAFVVRDDHQGRGLGSILLEHLAAAARECGLTRFVAEVLTENHQMVRVFRDAGFEVSRALEGSTLHLEFDVASTSRAREVQLAREQRAEARSVANVLSPRSVAVVGASPDETKIGHVVLANLLIGEFTGPVYPVHPEARSVRGVRAYPSVTEIPDDVDLAVLAVPPDEVPGVFDACLEKGVRGLVVITSGFGETGPDRARGAAGAGHRRPRERHAGGGSERARRRQPGQGRVAQRLARAAAAPAGPGGLLLPVRRARHPESSPPRPSAASGCRRSSRPATAPTSRATTSCSTGTPTPTPTSSCSTSRPSATRASSPGSRGGSPGRSP